MAEYGASRAEVLRLHLLVLRCQAGDELAFVQLFDRFGPRTLGYLKGLIGEAAEDVQQEVWLAVYRGIHALSSPAAFRTWLFRTTRHRAVDHLRKLKRERELIADVPFDAVAASDPAAGGSIALDERSFDAVLAELPAAQREVLLLRYRDDMSYAEIALVAGCSVGTVRSRLHHAKRRARDLLTERDRVGMEGDGTLRKGGYA
jgi:RNA polymerase sigma-70 factor (ECF subfamily)